MKNSQLFQLGSLIFLVAILWGDHKKLFVTFIFLMIMFATYFLNENN